MPCYHPLVGLDQGIRQDTGKRFIKVLKRSEISDYGRKQATLLPISCGRCIGCRLERSRQWATRAVHESSLYPENCFITLTFRDACPLDGTKTDPTFSLYKHHFQRFMKRLRREFALGVLSHPKKNGYLPRFKSPNIRYLHCGEYGENLGRPHHHACLFNFDFFDKQYWKTKEGNRYYTSEILNNLWPHGMCIIGDVTFESAAYVARYIEKKVNGENAEYYYDGKLPEYSTMSRRPGLGKQWMKKYTDDIFPKDYVVIRGERSNVPKYYNKLYELTNPDEYVIVRDMRLNSAKNNPDNNTARLHAGEIIKKAQMATVPRNSI